MPKFTKESARKILQYHLDQGAKLDIGNDAEVRKWRLRTEITLRHVFGEQGAPLTQFKQVRWFPATTSLDGDNSSVIHSARQSGLRASIAILESALYEVEHFWGDGNAVGQTNEASRTSSTSSRVFIVHGHDEAMKLQVARTIAQLGLDPVILHEQADQGRTIIEKFESHADVGFAIVLCSADDMAYARGDVTKSAKPRPRQNVVLELGYFVGKLGRSRVLVLRPEGAMELPSDISGVVYTPFDSHGGWKTRLVRELRAAGYMVDANKIV